MSQYLDNTEPKRGPHLLKYSFFLMGLIAVAYGTYWFFLSKKDSTKPSDTVLNIAKDTMLTGDYSKAIEKIESSLISDNNITAEQIAHRKLALAIAYTGVKNDTLAKNKGIDYLVDIVNQPEYPEEVKTQAVYATERLLFSSEYNEIRDFLKNKDIYSQIVTSSTDFHSLSKRLLEFGKSFSSFAPLDFKLAYLHSKEAYEIRKTGVNLDSVMKASLEQKRTSAIDMIRQAQFSLNREFFGNDHLEVYIPTALMYKALAIHYLSQSGLDFLPTGESSEKVFQTSFEASDKYYSRSLPLTEYFYLVFLSQNKPEDGSDAEKKGITIINKWLSDRDFSTSYLGLLFGKEKSNSLGEKESLLIVADTFPIFKELLKNSGWVEDDFRK